MAFHGEGVAEDELDPLPAAEVGQPVPGEDTLDGDDEALAEGFDGLQERLGCRADVLVEEDSALPVENAEVHGPGVQVDAAVGSVGLRVESHGPLLKGRGFVFRQAYSGWGRRRRGPG